VLGLTLAGSLKQLVLFGAFLVGETVLMKLHLWFITRYGNTNVWERRAAVLLALLPLVLVKVAGLFHFPSLGFLGASYLTFRAVQVIVEISDKLVKTQSVLDYLYFVAFFPTRLVRPDRPVAPVPAGCAATFHARGIPGDPRPGTVADGARGLLQVRPGDADRGMDA